MFSRKALSQLVCDIISENWKFYVLLWDFHVKNNVQNYLFSNGSTNLELSFEVFVGGKFWLLCHFDHNIFFSIYLWRQAELGIIFKLNFLIKILPVISTFSKALSPTKSERKTISYCFLRKVWIKIIVKNFFLATSAMFHDGKFSSSLILPTEVFLFYFSVNNMWKQSEISLVSCSEQFWATKKERIENAMEKLLKSLCWYLFIISSTSCWCL